MIFARRSAPDAPRPPGSVRRVLRGIASPTGVALVAVAVVGGIAAVISYSHMLDWAKANEDEASEWRSYLFPVSVDGAIVAASAVLYADSRAGRRADWLAYLIVSVGVMWSIVANVAHDTHGWAAEKGIAAWPPIALALVMEMVSRFVRRMSEQAEALVEAAEQAEQAAREWAAEAARLAEEKAAEEAKAEERRRERRERERQRQQEASPEEPEAEVLQLRATGTEGASRPHWLTEGATAEQAMHAYLADVDPNASGADLDRIVGTPHFGTRSGYGRKVARKWREQQNRQEEE